MRVVVLGAGELGFQVAKRLSEESHDIVVVDNHEERLRRVDELLDVSTIRGHGSIPAALMDAELPAADVLVAVTRSDEANLVACLLAQTLSPETVRVARLRDEAYRGWRGVIYESALNVHLAISPEAEAARSVGLLADTPGVSDVMEFVDGMVLVVSVTIDAGSPMLGVTLRQVRSDADGAYLVAGLYRNGMVYAPSEDLEIGAGDTLFIITTRDALGRILIQLGKRWSRTRYAMIAGGGRVGELIAARLSEKGVHTRIIESDAATCERLTNELRNAIVLHGQATDQDLLAEEGIARTDLFVSALEEEEKNVFTALLAKRLGAKRVVSLVNTNAYMPFASQSGIDVVLSPILAALGPLLHFVRRGKLLGVEILREEIVEGVEFRIPPDSKIVDQSLGQLRMPHGSIIGAIVRGDLVIYPSGSTILKAEDRVVLFARPFLFPRLERLLGLTGEDGA